MSIRTSPWPAGAAGLADPWGAAFWVGQAPPDAPQPDRAG